MKILVIKTCDTCPFFDSNEFLDRGLYMTGDYDPICEAPDSKVEFNCSKRKPFSIEQITDLVPPTECPLREGIQITL